MYHSIHNLGQSLLDQIMRHRSHRSGDIKAQQERLDGFGVAWAECPDDEAIESILHGDGRGGTSVYLALARALEGRGELLRQLRSHHADRASLTLH